MHGMIGIRSTYKTADELRISQQELNALAWFVDRCDQGLVKEVDPDSRLTTRRLYTGAFRAISDTDIVCPEKFDMDHLAIRYECSTAGCILGWTMHRAPSLQNTSRVPSYIHDLFYNYPHKSTPVTPVQARDATVRFLSGKHPWIMEV